MNLKTLEKAIALAKKVGSVFVATADTQGIPHLAVAGKVVLTPEGRVAVTEWFCPGTMENLKVNRQVALAVWDAKKDIGYQLIGESEKVEDLLMMNGYAPEKEEKTTRPQVKWQVIIRVDKITDFMQAPHSDIEE